MQVLAMLKRRLRRLRRTAKSLLKTAVIGVTLLGQAGALGLVVGSAAFLISSEDWWSWLSVAPGEVAWMPLLVEHRSAAYETQNRFGEPLLPDRGLTPGATVDVPRLIMCEIGYAASVRDVPMDVWNEVFERYGLFWGHRREFEVDHLIPLSLAGSNRIENLWPESRMTEPWNAEVKDTLEDVLHRLVCAGQVGLEEAQDAIRTDWIAAYRKYVGAVPRRFVPRSGIVHNF